MKSDEIRGRIIAAVYAMDNMVGFPVIVHRNEFTTDWTDTLLPYPERTHLKPTAKLVKCAAIGALFEVVFPSGVIGIGTSIDLDVATDVHTRQLE